MSHPRHFDFENPSFIAFFLGGGVKFTLNREGRISKMGKENQNIMPNENEKAIEPESFSSPDF
ncbi:MAG: hypothetical protein ABFC97_04340, partial [Anaerolineaceae bacterium]